VHPSVVGLQQDGIDPGEEGRDGVDDLHPHGLHLGGVLRHAPGAAFDVAADLGVRRDDPNASEPGRIGRVLRDPGSRTP
jgi:hypothetical protein